MGLAKETFGARMAYSYDLVVRNALVIPLHPFVCILLYICIDIAWRLSQFSSHGLTSVQVALPRLRIST